MEETPAQRVSGHAGAGLGVSAGNRCTIGIQRLGSAAQAIKEQSRVMMLHTYQEDLMVEGRPHGSVLWWRWNGYSMQAIQLLRRGVFPHPRRSA